MAKVYLAAPYTERPEQLVIASAFIDAGHVVTSSWVFGGEEGKTRAEIAYSDAKDVRDADWLVLRTFHRGTMNTGGGRHFEFGLAYALGKRCVIVGGLEHVFCHLQDVKQVSTYDEALLYIAQCEV